MAYKVLPCDQCWFVFKTTIQNFRSVRTLRRMFCGLLEKALFFLRRFLFTVGATVSFPKQILAPILGQDFWIAYSDAHCMQKMYSYMQFWGQKRFKHFDVKIENVTFQNISELLLSFLIFPFPAFAIHFIWQFLEHYNCLRCNDFVSYWTFTLICYLLAWVLFTLVYTVDGKCFTTCTLGVKNGLIVSDVKNDRWL